MYRAFLFGAACALIPALAALPASFALTPAVAFASDAAQKGMNLLETRPTITPSSAHVSVTGSGSPGLTVNIRPGTEQYPGIRLSPSDGKPVWDLSAFGHVEARIANTGTKPLTLALRVDNDGQGESWNTEAITLPPGETGTVTTLFGHSYGKKPGYRLDPKAVVRVLLFAHKSDAEQSFRVESLAAAGPAGEKPPVDPESVRVTPDFEGSLIGSAGFQLVTDGGAQASSVPLPTGRISQHSLRVTLPAATSGGGGVPSVSIKPRTGRWDLRDALEVRVRIRNAGTSPVTPRVRVNSNGGPREVTARTPFAPGAAATITVPFVAPAVVDLAKPETAARFTSDAVSAITLSAATDTSAAERALVVESVTAEMPPAPKLPEWLGKRPPVPGDWVKTLSEEFNGTTLDTRIWDPEGENYYDKTTHWSKKNVLVGGGVARLRYEKRTGFHNDDPKRNKTDYASGYLNTYGKWTQRYGYFEARMKMPAAPGLWPAFWMMPERGVAAGPEQWKRQDTRNGGMEFDMMEHLTRWGPTRFNVAMHWDGYDKDHRSIGTDALYAPPDRDGFITVGLLWTPGLAVYYYNGREAARWDNPRIANVPSAIMFTLPMGGWDNNALDDARLPADFIIDYVRVWQRKDLAAEPAR